MIYDCFSYWDEDLLLDLRLNILNKIVDYFVIVEGNKTWQNNPKKLRFDINKFSSFKKKIIYIPPFLLQIHFLTPSFPLFYIPIYLPFLPPF